MSRSRSYNLYYEHPANVDRCILLASAIERRNYKTYALGRVFQTLNATDHGVILARRPSLVIARTLRLGPDAVQPHSQH